MWTKLFMTVAFVVIPVLWGVAVHGLFDLWNGRSDDDPQDEGVFPDYQI